MNQERKIIAIIGPTASGKTDLAIELAKKHNGDVISTDSRQVYKGLDLGTGKVTKEEMGGVPHHMLSVYELDQKVSVAQFVEDALPILEDILTRGKTPILCGGTGQYTHALLYQESLPEVAPNQALRDELIEHTEQELYNMLLAKDKERAQTIDKHNKLRLIRALEIIETLGKVPKKGEAILRYNTVVYRTEISRELLKKRITRRLEKRIELGLIKEVEEIVHRGYNEQELKRFGIEYYVIAQFLSGALSYEAMKQEVIHASYLYAKRQETWNKKFFKDTIPVEIRQ